MLWVEYSTVQVKQFWIPGKPEQQKGQPELVLEQMTGLVLVVEIVETY